MKILVISHMYPSVMDEATNTMFHEQTKSLVRQGCEVKVISPVPFAPFPINKMSKKWKSYSEIPFKQIRENIEVYYPKYLLLPKGILFQHSGYFMYKGILRLVEELYSKFKFDLIHSHVALPDGYAAMKLVERIPVPYIVTIHGQDFASTIYRNNSCYEAVKKTLSKSRKVILVSSKLKERQQQIFKEMDDSLFFVVHNGTYHNFLDINEPAKTSITTKGNPIILSVSNLVDLKGINDNLIALSHIVTKFPKIHYYIIGDGPEREKLINLAYELNISDKVSFLGVKSQDEVKEYMDICDVFSLPSWNEAFGVVYIEAMARGKVVIGCEGQGIKDIVTNGMNGFMVAPKTPTQLAQLLIEILSNTDLRKEVGKKARERVLEAFTWEQNAKKMYHIYNEAIQSYNR